MFQFLTSCQLKFITLMFEGFMGAEVRSSIIGGKNSAEGRWPWMVHLNITTDDGEQKWRCGGTILNNYWVLTAGRCWDEYVSL